MLHKVNVIKQVSLNLTADDWELYTKTYPDLEGVARMINTRIAYLINVALNQGGRVEDVRKVCLKVLEDYSKVGAADSEPRYVLDCILTKVYNV